jgi:hypothetical protein
VPRKTALFCTLQRAAADYGSSPKPRQNFQPQDIPLKDPKQFHIYYSRPRPIPDKANGSAQYGIDVRQPNALCGCGATPGVWRESWSFDAVKGGPRRQDVIQISNGVAVIADNT